MRRNARRRTGSVRSKRRTNHTMATAPAELEQHVPPHPGPRSGARRPSNEPTGERPPEDLRPGEGAVEHEVEERADRQEDPAAPCGPAADRGQHHHHEQHDAERDRVQRPGAAEERRRRGRAASRRAGARGSRWRGRGTRARRSPAIRPMNQSSTGLGLLARRRLGRGRRLLRRWWWCCAPWPWTARSSAGVGRLLGGVESAGWPSSSSASAGRCGSRRRATPAGTEGNGAV